jgi:NADH dehydrogenase
LSTCTRTQPTGTVLTAPVRAVDLKNKRLELAEGNLDYDYLIYAPGAANSYFGHAEWERFAPGLKSVEDAVEIRRRVLVAFERAERGVDDDERQRLQTFVVIGGGPTGVELAGAIAELSRTVLASEFRRIDPGRTKVILIEAGARILPSFDDELAQRAVDQLSEIGVDVRVGAKVTTIDADGVVVQLKDVDGSMVEERIEARTVVWGAGVAPTALGKTLGVPLDRAGRVIVEADCTIPGHRDAFAIGDAAAYLHTPDKRPLPGVSPVAMQQARTVAKSIVHALDNKPYERFEYFDKGSMATIGRSRAIAQTGALRLTGFMAWLAWLVVHLIYLIGFRNRISVLANWAYAYFSYRRGARLITDHWQPPETREESPMSVRGREWTATRGGAVASPETPRTSGASSGV